jgi:hypothetical protein
MQASREDFNEGFHESMMTSRRENDGVKQHSRKLSSVSSVGFEINDLSRQSHMSNRVNCSNKVPRHA